MQSDALEEFEGKIRENIEKLGGDYEPLGNPSYHGRHLCVFLTNNEWFITNKKKALILHFQEVQTCHRVKATNILNVPQLNVSPLKHDKRKEIDF